MKMTFDIPTPEELSSADYEKAVQLAVNKMVERIKEANANGERKTLWCCSRQYVNEVSYDVDDAVRKIFKSKGYWFEDYGYCGGVWQVDTYNICW